MKFAFTLLALAFAASAANAAPEVKLQPIFGPNNALPSGSINHTGMSRSGRYVLIPNKYGVPEPAFYVRDLKTQTTTKVSASAFSLNFIAYAISANGQYIAHFEGGALRVLNLANNSVRSMPAQEPSNIGLADNGAVLYLQRVNNSYQLLMLRQANGDEQILADSRQYPAVDGSQLTLTLNDNYERNPLSRDGKSALFSYAGNYYLWQQGQSSLPLRANLAMEGFQLANTRIGQATLSSDGDYLAFATKASWNDADGSEYSQRFLHVAKRSDLTPAGVTPEAFDLAPHHIKISGRGLSLSAGGRFITFLGYLQPGHAEYAASEAVTPGSSERVLRYDSHNDELVTLSITHDGKGIAGPSGFAPILNPTTVISDDGSMAVFPTNASNLLPFPHTDGSGFGEWPFHVYADNGYARNYQFVDMPNSDNGWKMFSPMALIDDNLWQGFITFDGVGTDALKFDVGGSWNGFNFVPTANWAESYGSGGGAGQAIRSGGNINVVGGAGTYRITFNDATKAYTITKQQSTGGDWQRTVIFIKGQTVSGQDMFIRGGIDHTYAQNVIGRSCTSSNMLCAIPIRYRNLLNPYTANWKGGDTLLDWHGKEPSQNGGNANGLAEGSVLDWTTNNSGNANKVAVNGVGYSPLNTWGDHYWMLDVDMDCSKTVNGWFELKSFISGGPGWEGNVSQSGTPYSSGNHFARCGQLNMFERGSSAATFRPLP